MSNFLLDRRQLFKGIAAVSVFGLSATPVRAAQSVRLKFASISSPTHILNRILHREWIDKVKAATNGEVDITLFPGGSLGKAKEAYDVALSGIADISYGWTIYYPGRFPLTESLTLPGAIPDIDQAHNSWDIYDKFLQSDWSEVKLLWLGIAPGYMITSREIPIRAAGDLKGLKVGVIGSTAADVARRLDATPIDVTAQNAYLALQRKTIDAYINTWSSVAANKYGEVARYFTDTSLFNSVFFAVMNKKKYEALPDEVRAAIDANSKKDAFVRATDVYWDNQDNAKKSVIEHSGGKGEILTWSDSETTKYRKLVAPVWDEWRKKVAEQGKTADAIIDYLRQT